MSNEENKFVSHEQQRKSICVEQIHHVNYELLIFHLESE